MLRDWRPEKYCVARGIHRLEREAKTGDTDRKACAGCHDGLGWTARCSVDCGFHASIGPIVAQVTPLDIFGGLLGAAQIQSARETWARLSTLDRFCVDRALARRNTTIEGLIQSGIGPDDGRLGSIFGECRRFTEPNLRRNVGCTTTDEHGWSVATTCNQTFATRDGNNQVHPVEPREAIELHFSGTRIVVAEVETGEARETRQARAEAQGRPSNSRCSRPTSPRISATHPRSCVPRPRGSRAGSSSSSRPAPGPPRPTRRRSTARSAGSVAGRGRCRRQRERRPRAPGAMLPRAEGRHPAGSPDFPVGVRRRRDRDRAGDQRRAPEGTH